MPDITTVLIVGGVWMLLALLAWSLAVAAGRSEPPPERLGRDRAPAPAPASQPVVANVGSLRARLRAAATLIEAQQLVVSAEIGGSEAVLATSRPVIAVEDGDQPAISVPVVRGGREVATLRAVRRPGDRPFQDADRQLLAALAARMAADVEVAGRPEALAVGRSRAMA